MMITIAMMFDMYVLLASNHLVCYLDNERASVGSHLCISLIYIFLCTNSVDTYMRPKSSS
jgi:hypothetical protein